MTLPEAIEVMRAHQVWRQGRDRHPEPLRLCQAIDTVLAHFDEPEGQSDGAIYSAYSRRDASDPVDLDAVLSGKPSQATAGHAEDAFDPLGQGQGR